MEENSKIDLLCVYQEVFEQLYIIDSILKLTKNFCLELEFKGEYYGACGNASLKFSAERNNYINMINVLEEKITNIKNLNLSAEERTISEQNTNN